MGEQTTIGLDKKLVATMDSFIEKTKPKYRSRAHLVETAFDELLKKEGKENGE